MWSDLQKNKKTPKATVAAAVVVIIETSHMFDFYVHALDIVSLRESSSQRRSGMAHVLKGSHSFTCTPTCSFAFGMSHTCLCLPSYN